MLIGINPLLTGELLLALDSLGHNDRVLIADGNLPTSGSSATVLRTAATALEMLEAVLSVYPLENCDGDALITRADYDGADLNENQVKAMEIIGAGSGIAFVMPPRAELRATLSTAQLIILTTDYLPACYFLRKGVVLPPETPQ